MIRPFIESMLVCVLLSVASPTAAAPPENQRYPFDPACGWGRISDGRGLFVRCLTRQEAERLLKTADSASAAKPPPSEAVGPNGTSAAPVQNQQKASTPTGTVAPPTAEGTQGTAAGATAQPSAQPTESPTGTSKDALIAELVGVVADEGELPLAKKKLAVPADRYAQCVADHGGLTAPNSQITVRFLVRERGRAEGTSVEKFQGMTEAAANCIAQVVDRRPTGAPEAPVVGAAVTIRIKKRPGK